MSALSKLLNEANDLSPMSLRKRAAKIGDRISHATIGDYQRGQHAENPDAATLLALAEAYDLGLAEVQAAASVGVGAGPWEPPAEVTQLSRRQQNAITELIMSMVERGGSSDGRQPDAEKMTDPEPPGPRSLQEFKNRRLSADGLPEELKAADDRGKTVDQGDPDPGDQG